MTLRESLTDVFNYGDMWKIIDCISNISPEINNHVYNILEECKLKSYSEIPNNCGILCYIYYWIINDFLFNLKWFFDIFDEKFLLLVKTSMVDYTHELVLKGLLDGKTFNLITNISLAADYAKEATGQLTPSPEMYPEMF